MHQDVPAGEEQADWVLARIDLPDVGPWASLMFPRLVTTY